MGNGGWRMQFNDRSAMMSCGDLDQEQRFYTIGIVNGQAAIKIDITPKPFLLYLRPDGMLADAGPVVVNGRVVAGSSGGGTSNGQWVTSQNTTTQTLTPMEAQQYAGQSNLPQTDNTTRSTKPILPPAISRAHTPRPQFTTGRKLKPALQRF
jgi:hypothetical protein